MNGSTRRVMMPLACAALGAALLMALGLRAAAVAPTRVAVVRMSVLLDKLAQQAAIVAQLKARGDALQQQLTAKTKEIDDLKKELQDMPEANLPQEKLDDLKLKSLKLDNWGALARKEFLTDQGLLREDLNIKIRKAIAELAQLQGYDLVIFDDSEEEPLVNPKSEIPPALQRAEQLSQRRILYRDKEIDITEELTVRMNNAFKQGPN